MMDLEEQNDRPGGTMSDETADETGDVPEDGRNGETHGVRTKTVADLTRCAAFADEYSLYQGDDFLTLHADCGYARLYGGIVANYVPGSFRRNADGTYSWRISNDSYASDATFYPKGIQSPLFAQIPDDGFSLGYDRIDFGGYGYLRGVVS